MRRAVLLLVVTGCGRINFDEIGILGQPPPCALEIESREIVSTGMASDPSLAAAIDELGLAFVDNKEVKLLRLTAGGDVIGTPIDVGPAGEDAAAGPGIAWSGNDFAIVRNMGRVGATGPVLFNRFDPGGARIGTDVTVSTHGSTSAPAVIAWNGSRYAAAWGAFDIFVAESGLWFAPLGADGTRLAQGLDVGNGADSQCDPGLSWAQTQWGITYVNEFGFGGSTAGITRVDADGGVVASPAALSDKRDIDSAILASGSSFITARSVPFDKELRIARVEADGTITQTAARASQLTRVRLANLDDQVIVAWIDASGVWLWSLDPQGQPYAEPILLAEAAGANNFAIAVIDHAVVVVWERAFHLWISHAACT